MNWRDLLPRVTRYKRGLCLSDIEAQLSLACLTRISFETREEAPENRIAWTDYTVKAHNGRILKFVRLSKREVA